jgi:hypothetical protein
MRTGTGAGNTREILTSLKFNVEYFEYCQAMGRLLTINVSRFLVYNCLKINSI